MCYTNNMPPKKKRKKKNAKPDTEVIGIFDVEVGDAIYDPQSAEVADVVWVGIHGGGKKFPTTMKLVDARLRGSPHVGRLTGALSVTVERVINDGTN